jgi:hypothetical protein
MAGLTANLLLQPKNLTVNWSNTISYVVFNAAGSGQRQGTQFETSIDVSVKVTPTLSFSGNGNFNTPGFNWQGSRGGWRSYSFTVNKDISHTGVSISCRVDGLFAGYQKIVEKTATETFTQSTENRFVNRSIRIGTTWKFGKKDLKTPTSKSISVDN